MDVLKEKFILSRSKANDLSSVKSLNFWGAQLSDVSLLCQVPNAEVINASANKIEHLESFSRCTKLKELYLRKNKIKNIEEVLHLKELKSLRYLWLSGNPFAKYLTNQQYRSFVLRCLPHLKKLDDITVTAEQVKDALRCGFDAINQERKLSQSSSGNSTTSFLSESCDDQKVTSPSLATEGRNGEEFDKSKPENVNLNQNLDKSNLLNLSDVKNALLDKDVGVNDSSELIQHLSSKVHSSKADEISQQQTSVVTTANSIDEVSHVYESDDSKNNVIKHSQEAFSESNKLEPTSLLAESVDSCRSTDFQRFAAEDNKVSSKIDSQNLNSSCNRLQEDLSVDHDKPLSDEPLKLFVLNVKPDDINDSTVLKSTEEKLLPDNSKLLSPAVVDDCEASSTKNLEVSQVCNNPTSSSQSNSENPELAELNKIRVELGSKPLSPDKFYSSSNSSRLKKELRSSNKKKKQIRKKNNILSATLALVEELDEESLQLLKEKIDEKLQQISQVSLETSSLSSIFSDKSVGELSMDVE